MFLPKRPKWRPFEADWGNYKEGIKLVRSFESFDCHLETYTYFTDVMLTSAESSIPKTTGKPRRPAVPGWDKKCGTLRKITRRCYKKYKSSGTPTSKVIYQRAMAKKCRYFRKAQQNSWLYYINDISSKTPSRVVWRRVRKLAGKFIPAKTPSLKVGDTLVTNSADVAECLGQHFSEVSTSRNYTAEFQRIRDTQVALDLSGDDHEAYNARFSLHELHNALSSTEDTSPGEDTILYAMLRQLPDEAESYLLKIINRIWETGVLPKGWKIAIVLVVQKPNKDPHYTTRYRPISLTSCMRADREDGQLSFGLALGGSQSAFSSAIWFRKNRSTLDEPY